MNRRGFLAAMLAAAAGPAIVRAASLMPVKMVAPELIVPDFSLFYGEIGMWQGMRFLEGGGRHYELPPAVAALVQRTPWPLSSSITPERIAAQAARNRRNAQWLQTMRHNPIRS